VSPVEPDTLATEDQEQVQTVPAEPALTDIIVTAQRREERLQDVPIAVSTISGLALEARGADNTQDLQIAVPGLVYSNTVGFAQPYLRGIGHNITQPNVDPAVATYIDGVFVSFNQGTITNLLGVQRVEVLKGPQGTLFGRNAVAGAISVITLSPRQQTDARLAVSIGNYEHREISGHFSGGVANGLAAGIYFGGSKRNSYYNNLVTPVCVTCPPGRDYPDQPEGHEEWGVRGKLVYDTGGALRASLSFEHSETDSEDLGTARQIQDNALGYVFGAPVVDRPHVVSLNDPHWDKLNIDTAILRIDADLGPAAFVSITGFRDVLAHTSADFDGTSLPILRLDSTGQFSTQYSQELQLQSPTGSSWSWIVGVHGFYEHSGLNDQEIGSQFLFGPVPIQAQDARVKNTALAAFGSVTIPIRENFRLTLGGRFTHETKKFQATVGPKLESEGPFLSFIRLPNREEDWQNFAPRVTFDYRINDTLLYATYSKGFRSGIFNLAAPQTPGPADPEKLTSYEVGSKSAFFANRLRLNTSAFHYIYKDMQVQTINPFSGTIIDNAASAKIYGVEIDVTGAVTRGLELRASAAWLNAKYDEFRDFASFQPAPVGNALVFVDVSGSRLPRAPELTATIGAQYSTPVGNLGSLIASVDYYYNDGFFWEPSNQARFREGSYNVLNASVRFSSSDDRWSLALWGKNLFDEYYATTYSVSAQGTLVADAPPRIYGLTLGWTL